MLHIVGVRHHSPACARLVQAAIRRLRPRWVLIEGPYDFNPRLHELLLAHTPPVALFSYWQRDGRRSACWSPFCDFSPEWVALRTGREVGAEIRFIDLPPAQMPANDTVNAYADHRLRYARAVQAMCARFGKDDSDSLWDFLFEQPLAEADLEHRLRLFFDEIRAIDPGDDEECLREEFMATCIRAALAEGGTVVVVCGGFHAPALERLAGAGPDAWPVLPRAPLQDVDAAPLQEGAYLVPFTFKRLASFAGYDAGMPSPAWYQALWVNGAEHAASVLSAEVVERLRSLRQHVSAADLIAARAACEGLTRLRGHAVVSRTDVLDGFAAALCKDVLDAPLPWTERGFLRPGTDPLLVEMVAVFCGTRSGKLAPETPQPPLLNDVLNQLSRFDLEPTSDGRVLALSLHETADLARSRVLHCLGILAIPGFERAAGPSWPTERELVESWSLVERWEMRSAIIESCGYGPTLQEAAAARLEERFEQDQGDLAALALLLARAVFAGIRHLQQRAIEEIGDRISAEPDLEAVGKALRPLLGLWRHDVVLGAAGSDMLGQVIERAFARGLWLVEGLRGTGQPLSAGLLDAIVALRDVCQHGRGLQLDTTAARGVMARRSVDRDAPHAVRGAALGYLWSTGSPSEDEAMAGLRATSPASCFGDFLSGLFALAREEVLRGKGLLEAVDRSVSALDTETFQIALPALRIAFGYFPPHEREAIGTRLMGTDGPSLVTPDTPVDLAVLGYSLDAAVETTLRRYGLVDGPAPGVTP